MRTPRAVTPLANEYEVIGNMIRLKMNIYEMTDAAFVRVVMQMSNGHFNPDRAKKIYNNLMQDAALPPNISMETYLLEHHPEILDEFYKNVGWDK